MPTTGGAPGDQVYDSGSWSRYPPVKPPPARWEGPPPQPQNVISGNQEGGLAIIGGSSTADLVQGNFIACTDSTGTAADGERVQRSVCRFRLLIHAYSRGIGIGGDNRREGRRAGNVISGNDFDKHRQRRNCCVRCRRLRQPHRREPDRRRCRRDLDDRQPGNRCPHLRRGHEQYGRRDDQPPLTSSRATRGTGAAISVTSVPRATWLRGDGFYRHQRHRRHPPGQQGRRRVHLRWRLLEQDRRLHHRQQLGRRKHLGQRDVGQRGGGEFHRY